MTPDVRITYDESNESYHNGSELSLGSTLINMSISQGLPALSHALLNKDKQEPKPHFMEGTLWHMVQEKRWNADQLREHIEIVPQEFVTTGGSLSTSKASKVWIADQQALGKMFLLPKSFDNFVLMIKKFWENEAVREIESEDGIREMSVRVKLEKYPFLLKARPDYFTNANKLVDYKTTKESNVINTWKKSAYKYGYGLSAALYGMLLDIAGMKPSPMHFIVTSTATFETQVFRITQESLDLQKQFLNAALANIKINWDDIASGIVKHHGVGDIHDLEL